MPSPSVSGLHESRRNLASVVSGSRSLSSSDSCEFGVPSWSQSGLDPGAEPVPGSITGDRALDVKNLPKRRESTRILKRVGVDFPPTWVRKGSSLLVSLTLIVVAVALSALRKTAWARGRWKAIVLRNLPERKCRPRIVSVWPIASFFGEIDVTTGGLGRAASPAAGEKI